MQAGGKLTKIFKSTVCMLGLKKGTEFIAYYNKEDDICYYIPIDSKDGIGIAVRNVPEGYIQETNKSMYMDMVPAIKALTDDYKKIMTDLLAQNKDTQDQIDNIKNYLQSFE
jgi:hypothetical protein